MKIILAAVAIGLAAPAAAANLVANGGFETTTATDKGRFLGQVAGWSGGDGLDFIDLPGTADDPHKYLSVYGVFPRVSPDGGNFVEADGDRKYGTPITQTVTGLTPGKTYRVGFYQAAGQQRGFTGPTTEHWDVSLGDETHHSATFHLAQGGVGGWQHQSLGFTATGASEVLQFFAAGTPNGKPPIAFLDGVTLTASAPEPAAWALMFGGFALVGTSMRQRTRAVAA
ncbi:MAG: PEPxxWA-CTERM sorting domain-containing protein [Sphingomonadaceae bacterium]|nr:PEPxxWA-CTERM sorting domain-containing protein [Sphingomonadaceae bacterium]